MDPLIKKLSVFAIGVVIACLMVGCAQPATPTPAAPTATVAAPTATVAAPTPTEESLSLEGVTITWFTHSLFYDLSGGDEGLVRDFEEATGAKVDVVLLDSEPLREKILVEVMAGTAGWDVAHINYAWLNPELAQYLEPLDTYIEDAEPEYEFDDMIGSLVEAGRFDGVQKAIPYRIGTAMLYYRKDLFEERGMSVPETWEDFLKAAEELTIDSDNDGQVDIYGVVQRGKPGYEVMQDYVRYLFAHGGEFLNKEMTSCELDNDAGVAALKDLVTIYQEGWAPPDMLAVGRDEYIAYMQQGRAAMGVYMAPYWEKLIDPEASLVTDKVAWALVPHSPGVEPGRTMNAGWCMGINADSDNKAAAWAFVEALTNKEAQLFQALNGNGPIRQSSYLSEAYLEKFPLAEDWLKATAASVFEPTHELYPQMQDIASEEITYALDGTKSPEDAMMSACDRIDALLQ